MSYAPVNLELSLQIIYVEPKILVVCTGSSGESYSVIENEKVNRLIKDSLKIHRDIDRLIKTQIKEGKISSRDRSKIADNLRKFGQFLFQCIFTNETLDLLNVAIGQSLKSNKGVTIQLMIASDFLNLVPWEIMFNDDMYISHAYDVVRHPFISQPVRKQSFNKEILKILFIGANLRKSPINVNGHIKAIKEVCNSCSREVKAEFLVTPKIGSHAEHDISNKNNSDLIPNYKNIANKIYDGVDIMHILAHGEYTNANQGFYFLINHEDPQKQLESEKLPVEMLESYCRANPMRCVVLGSCRSDQALKYNSRSIQKIVGSKYYSMAHALIRAGIPEVIGMSHPISKLGEEIFTRRFYRTVVERGESVSQAVRQIRLELFAHADIDLLPSDWLTPVLYSRCSY